ncbi:histidine--tRNA ligase [Candidatus Pacearchaeota archaeon CG10_big_fil_rev_8_21_14_0_10_31_24]|nr:MAG: histidine--tRNA ligase [Candidatus Pacearchaeota archaeon CG10_big_fil_rev_8_21_14_0_10_31_24]
MFIEVDNVKGFQDFLPPESVKRKAIKQIIEKNFSLYGFLPVETSIIELDELMRPDILQSEDESVSDRFKLKDRGGRNLGLRYEFTFQLAKLFKLNQNIKLPFRRYQIGEVFRDEPVGPGRFRQFTQCDIDIVGDESINADTDLIVVVKNILDELKVEAVIQVNNRKLISSLIESVQIQEKTRVMRELDKIEKIGEDNVKSNLRKYADANQIITLFKLLEKDLKFFKENNFEGTDELEELQKRCKQRGIKIDIVPTMMRGLGYYTGNVFEVKQKGASGSIAAGGRYDKSVGKYVKRDIPAVGISFGLERMMSVSNLEPKASISALIISLEKENEVIKLTERMRKSNIPCLSSFDKIGKSLEFANATNIPYVIFLGDEEFQKKKLKLKDMTSGEEKLLSEKQIISLLKKI